MADRLSRLFSPRSVVVIGGSWAANVVRSLLGGGFEGAIWAVHPTKPTLGGVAAFRDLADLPGVPDAAFVGVNRHLTLPVLRQLRDMGAGGAICFASGFAESGAADLQSQLHAAAGDMPVLGPNCYGVLNYVDRVALWPDQHGGVPVSRGVGLISQSSNIAINLTMNARGLPIGKVACVGNGASVGVAELARHMIDDPRITAIGLYLEGVGDAAQFAHMAGLARAAGKPLVAIKVGRTAAAISAAQSHTAALAGDAVLSSAFLARCGVVEALDLAEMVETLKIFHVAGPLGGNRICTMSCSGGEAGLVADAAVDLDITFPAPAREQALALAEVLGSLVRIANPLDYHTFIWGDEAAMTAVFTTMLETGVDLGVLVMDLPHPERCDAAAWAPALAALKSAHLATGTPTALLTTLSEGVPEALAVEMVAHGITPLCGLREGMRAIELASRTAGHGAWAPLAPTLSDRSRLISEREAKGILAGIGIAVPRSLDDCPDLAGPFAVKALGLAHKSEAGGVRLNVAAGALEDAAQGLPGEGVLVEEMVRGVRAEMLLSVRRDPVYGASLTLGMGGTAAELLDDTRTMVLPVSGADIRAAIDGLRLAPLLHGYRGAAVCDLDAVVSAGLALASLIASDPTIVEIEINPLMVRETGAVAADALMRQAEDP